MVDGRTKNRNITLLFRFPLEMDSFTQPVFTEHLLWPPCKVLGPRDVRVNTETWSAAS